MGLTIKDNLKSLYDIIGILCISFLLIIANLSLNSTLRIILGIPFVIFFTGYTLTAVLFPQKDQLRNIERFGLSIGLSIPITFLLGFLLNYTPLGITSDSVLIALVLFVVLTCTLAFYRRLILPQDKQFIPNYHKFFLKGKIRIRQDKLFTAIFILSVLSVSGILFYELAKPKTEEKFTEFYLLDSNLIADEYPREIIKNQPIMIIIGISNNEYNNVEYTIKRMEEGKIEQIAKLQLDHGQTWEQRYTFTPTNPIANQKISFLLFKNNETTPLHVLHLWVTAQSAKNLESVFKNSDQIVINEL